MQVIMEYPINILIVPRINVECAQITIQSNSDSTYDDWYMQHVFGVFGTYRFVSIDPRGNNIYHANIQGEYVFICKAMNNNWVVRIEFL